jgi:hypothetical protein
VYFSQIFIIGAAHIVIERCQDALRRARHTTDLA